MSSVLAQTLFIITATGRWYRASLQQNTSWIVA